MTSVKLVVDARTTSQYDGNRLKAAPSTQELSTGYE